MSALARHRVGAAIVVAAVTCAAEAAAQYPAQPYPAQQPYPGQQPYAPQPVQPAPYPGQQPYPAPPYPPQQPYPGQQPYAPQPVQPAPYPGQPPYPAQPPYPGQQAPYPGAYPPAYPPQAPPPVAPPPVSDKRGDGEMGFLYGSTIAYGLGTGVWLDALFKVSDPGLAFIAPLGFAAAVPIGVYLWDANGTIHRGVPASIGTGILLGAVEGMAISGTQWQATHDAGNDWSFRAQTTLTFLTASAGGIGGWAFGEWLRPDPRSMTFIASGAGWGAISGTLMGAGLSGRDWKDGGSIGGLTGFNLGMIGAGALSTVYTPSYASQKWMWLGFLGGTAASSIVYVAYLFSDADPKHGLIANSIGGLAGLGLAAAFTARMSDVEPTAASTAWKPPPVQVGFAPLRGGATVQAFGTF